ncbi:hypothetical protein V5D56_10585 [Cellulosimicrobium sp. PMB13]|uniref:YqeB family protein n=1 Tax=Cellulosimicrobium sp. PMB13 TaxID=3120158 RepID=UPI003F4B4AFC
MPDDSAPETLLPDAVPADPSVVRPSALELAVLWTILPLLGAGIAVVVLRGTGWYAELPVAPFQGPARLVAELLADRGALGAVVALGLGAGAGLLLARHVRRDIAVVTVGPEVASVVLRDVTTDLARSEVTDVFVDRKALVVLGVRDGAPSGELAHVVTELETPRLEAAFRSHGWPWRDADPYAQEFRRWVPGDDALPTSADAVLRARSSMLEAKKVDDAADLRRELGRLGIVVRDVGSVQHWRATGEREPGSR